MREILFRGKRVDTGEWIFGSIVHQIDYYGDKCDRWFILEGDFTNDYDIDRPIEVQKETVGQYTGLKDKNGKRIFEGDVIKDDKHLYLIEWYAGDFDAGFLPFICSENFRAVRSCNCEIIGDIHDNPELLEGE